MNKFLSIMKVIEDLGSLAQAAAAPIAPAVAVDIALANTALQAIANLLPHATAAAATNAASTVTPAA